MRPGASASLDNGVRVLIDPWLSGPTFPAALRDGLAADVLVLTHGHVDHTGEIVEVAKRLGVPVLAPIELAGALAEHGVENTVGFNKGGTVEASGIAVHDDERDPHGRRSRSTARRAGTASQPAT